MSDRLVVTHLARSAWRDFRRAWGALVAYEVLFKLLEAWLFVPAVAVLLSAVLSRAGHVAVTNKDILDFLRSPSGLLYAALFGTLAVALLLFEQAGVMVIADLAGPGGRLPVARTLRATLSKPLRVAELGALTVGLLALTFAPFVGLLALTYRVFLSEHDINFYLERRPPAFWLAAGIGSALVLAALAVGVWLFVRWAFALPILLFEGRSARASLRASGERVRGAGWRIGAVLIGWQLASLAIGLALHAGFRLVAAALLAGAGERPIDLILGLLVVQSGLLGATSFVTVVGHGLLARRLYLVRGEQLGLSRPSGAGPDAAAPAPASPLGRLPLYAAAALVLLGPPALWAELTAHLSSQPRVRVTAHRGHSRAAPENTLLAIKKAIESGADYAEVDVQLTSDGVVVLLHDRDLKRVAGVPRRCGELSHDEIRKLDVGHWFGPAWAGERVPTLAEVIELSRGRIRLNIELKLYGPDRDLAPEVARVVHAHGFESDCLVTSFSNAALLDMKRQNPRLRTGIIVAQALGDVSRLDIEALSVRADGLTDEMLRAAHRRGLEVHAWTVNDRRQMDRLIKRGVDNIITDDPDLLVRIRDDWARLAGTERLLMASRLMLGLDR